MAAHPIEQVGAKLRAMMPWIKQRQLAAACNSPAGFFDGKAPGQFILPTQVETIDIGRQEEAALDERAVPAPRAIRVRSRKLLRYLASSTDRHRCERLRR